VRATHKLAKQSGGVGIYAEVSVSADRHADRYSVTISDRVFDWEREEYGSDAVVPKVKEDDEFVRGARKGVEYALAHTALPIDRDCISIPVETIRILLCDSTEDAVAYAACYATWQALEVEGCMEPKIVGRAIVFSNS
jgi:hypothetical protein